MLSMNRNIIYNKRKEVPLLRGRIYMINLFTYPLFASLIYTRELDILTKLSYGVYFIGNYFSVIASALYHNNRCEVFDRTVYKRIDYAGIFWSNISGSYPCLIHFTKSDIHVVLLVVHLLINIFGIFSSLSLNFINTTKWFRVLIFWLSHGINNICLYDLYTKNKYLAIFFYLVAYVSYLGSAIVYTVEKPNFIPGLFEFHELSHLLAVIGSTCVFIFNAISTGILKSNYI